MKKIFEHKNTLLVSVALGFLITSLPIWEFVSTTQRAGTIFLISGLAYSLIWLEADR